jgi:hypothetical protein
VYSSCAAFAKPLSNRFTYSTATAANRTGGDCTINRRYRYIALPFQD